MLPENCTNALGQPIGFPVPDWKPCPHPPRTPMKGRTCTLEPLSLTGHGKDLFDAYAADREDRIWTYLPYGPYRTFEPFGEWVAAMEKSQDPLFHAVVDSRTGKAVGIASYLRIDPAVGVIEVGHINFSPLMQRSVTSSEAMYLMMARVFDELGYRRYEWKCDALNAPSRSAALRLGFTYEGTFRQATMYKGRNRDTAWFSITDREWPAIRTAFQRWLSPENFNDGGVQKTRLSELIEQARK